MDAIVSDEQAIHLGHPSYTWRAGQERRLDILRQSVDLDQRRILDVGCGLGMYTEAFRRYSPYVYGIEVDLLRAVQALSRTMGVVQATGEAIPFDNDSFDVVFSHEVLEHVADDGQVVREAVRVTKPGGYIAIFVPNRLWPWETHGVYWRGQYHFGNIPLVNYLPDVWRKRLAWHVRVYTKRALFALFGDLPVRILMHRTIYPGFDNVVKRSPGLGRLVRTVSYLFERLSVLDQFGLSHFMVVEKTACER